MGGPRTEILTARLALTCLLFGLALSEGPPRGSAVPNEDFAGGTSGRDDRKPGFREGSSTDPEKPAVEVFETDGKAVDRGEFPESPVDEETIRRAEKMADEDLLSGLNRILRNKETLSDVFRAESVYEIP